MLTFPEVKKELGFTNEDIARFFGYKDAMSFNNSSRREYIEQGVVYLYSAAVANGESRVRRKVMSDLKEAFDKIAGPGAQAVEMVGVEEMKAGVEEMIIGTDNDDLL